MKSAIFRLHYPLAYLWECEGAEAAVAEHFAPALLVALASADEEVRDERVPGAGAGADASRLEGARPPAACAERWPRSHASAACPRRSSARCAGAVRALALLHRRRGRPASWLHAADDTAEPLSRLIAASGDALAALSRVVESFAGSGKDLGCLGVGQKGGRHARVLVDCGDARAVGRGGRRSVGAARGARTLGQHERVAVRSGRLLALAHAVLAVTADALGSLLQAGAGAAAAVLAAAPQLPSTLARVAAPHSWQLRRGSGARARRSTGPDQAAGRRRERRASSCRRRACGQRQQRQRRRQRRRRRQQRRRRRQRALDGAAAAARARAAGAPAGSGAQQPQQVVAATAGARPTPQGAAPAAVRGLQVAALLRRGVRQGGVGGGPPGRVQGAGRGARGGGGGGGWRRRQRGRERRVKQGCVRAGTWDCPTLACCSWQSM